MFDAAVDGRDAKLDEDTLVFRIAVKDADPPNVFVPERVILEFINVIVTPLLVMACVVKDRYGKVMLTPDMINSLGDPTPRELDAPMENAGEVNADDVGGTNWRGRTMVASQRQSLPKMAVCCFDHKN